MTGTKRGPAAVLAAACLAWTAGPAGAVQLGQVDSFAAGLQGWGTGANSPAPAQWVDGGGPGGVADAYLRLFATGGSGGGSRLVAIASDAWSGDFAAAGVTGVSMWLRNEGDTDLSLRLWLRGPAGNAYGLQPLLLAPGSGWQAAHFALRPADFSGPAAALLADLGELRLYHGSSAAFPSEAIAARLGIDQVSAVPEPAAAVLWLIGLALLAQRLLRRGRAAGHSLHQPE